jgi:hypothetical protein
MLIKSHPHPKKPKHTTTVQANDPVYSLRFNGSHIVGPNHLVVECVVEVDLDFDLAIVVGR